MYILQAVVLYIDEQALKNHRLRKKVTNFEQARGKADLSQPTYSKSLRISSSLACFATSSSSRNRLTSPRSSDR